MGVMYGEGKVCRAVPASLGLGENMGVYIHGHLKAIPMRRGGGLGGIETCVMQSPDEQSRFHFAKSDKGTTVHC